MASQSGVSTKPIVTAPSTMFGMLKSYYLIVFNVAIAILWMRCLVLILSGLYRDQSVAVFGLTAWNEVTYCSICCVNNSSRFCSYLCILLKKCVSLNHFFVISGVRTHTTTAEISGFRSCTCRYWFCTRWSCWRACIFCRTQCTTVRGIKNTYFLLSRNRNIR